MLELLVYHALSSRLTYQCTAPEAFLEGFELSQGLRVLVVGVGKGCYICRDVVVARLPASREDQLLKFLFFGHFSDLTLNTVGYGLSLFIERFRKSYTFLKILRNCSFLLHLFSDALWIDWVIAFFSLFGIFIFLYCFVQLYNSSFKRPMGQFFFYYQQSLAEIFFAGVGLFQFYLSTWFPGRHRNVVSGVLVL